MFGISKDKFETLKLIVFRDIANLENKTEALEGIINNHAKKVEELKNYCECSVCGSLVSKEKAKVEATLEHTYQSATFNCLTSEWVGKANYDTKAVKKFTCIHCQKGKRK